MIKLDDIIEALELDFNELNYFYDVANRCVVMITDEEFGYAEGEKALSNLPEWQRESVELAEKIMYSSIDEFIRLPDKHDLNEYRIMEHFIRTLELGQVRDELWNAIEGKGAFRRFKNQVIYYALDQEWYKYRDEAFMTFAKEWCESYNIVYEE